MMNELERYPSVTSAVVTDYDSGPKGGGLLIKLKFMADGKAYHASGYYTRIDTGSGVEFFGKSIPVIYSFKHPDKKLGSLIQG